MVPNKVTVTGEVVSVELVVRGAGTAVVLWRGQAQVGAAPVVGAALRARAPRPAPRLQLRDVLHTRPYCYTA